MAKKYSIPDTIKMIAQSGRHFDASPEIDGDFISFSTRDNGNVDAETPGAEDRLAAMKLIRDVEAACPNVRGALSECDEWSGATFRAYERKLPPRPPTRKLRNAALEVAAEVFKENATRKDFRVRWSSTGTNMFIEWRDPSAPRDQIDPAADFTISVIGGTLGNVLDQSSKSDPKSLEWKLALNVGRHSVELASLDKKDIAVSLDELSKTTDGLKDIFPLTYFVAKPGNNGFVSRRDYTGDGPGVYSKREAQRIQPFSMEFAERLAKACGGTIIEQRIGYPDRPLGAPHEPTLVGKAGAKPLDGTSRNKTL